MNLYGCEIGDNSKIGTFVEIQPILWGVIIGEKAMMGAGSVVTMDVPPYTIVARNPAPILQKLTQVIKRF